MKNKQKFARLLLLLGFFTISTASRGQTVMQRLKSHRATSHFAQALEDAQLNNLLNGDGPYTLFAPSNTAFDKLSNNQKTDKSLLLNHIITGMATERSLRAMSDITCLSGQTLNVKQEKNNHLSINSIMIINSNIRADNGVIHIIDGVIK